MKTQTQEICNAMKSIWITPLIALKKYGCFSLSSRVCEMKRHGYAVEKKWVTEGSKRFRAYRLEKR